jgi:hypothetical protein
VKHFTRLILSTLASLTLAGCLGTTYQTTDATGQNGTTFTSPSGKTVQAPPLALRSGDKGGESGGSGGRN